MAELMDIIPIIPWIGFGISSLAAIGFAVRCRIIKRDTERAVVEGRVVPLELRIGQLDAENADLVRHVRDVMEGRTELMILLASADEWISTARLVFEAAACSRAREIASVFASERSVRATLDQLDREMAECTRATSGTGKSVDAPVRRRVHNLVQLEQHRKERWAKLNALFTFVALHRLDKRFVLAVPGEQMRDWIVDVWARGDLVNGQFGPFQVPWAQELIAHTMATAVPPATETKAEAPAADA